MSKRIYVGGLSYHTTKEGLTEVFTQFGTVNDVYIITDRETQQSKGFAFVEMENDEEAVKAMQELNGAKLDGRTLTVNEARNKEERSFNGNRNRSNFQHR